MLLKFFDQETGMLELFSLLGCGNVTRKIAKCLSKLPKNDFTRNMIDFDTFTKIA